MTAKSARFVWLALTVETTVLIVVMYGKLVAFLFLLSLPFSYYAGRLCARLER